MGIYLPAVNGACAGSISVNNVAFTGFSVQVQRTSTTHTVGVSPAGTIAALALDGITTIGIHGSLDDV